MKLHKTQQTVIQDKARFKVLNCGAGWGKTQLAVEFIGYEAVHPRHSGKVVYLAPTEKQAREIVWDRLVVRYEGIAVSINSQLKEIKVKNIKGGISTIYLRGWESIENLRGNEYDAIVLDEVAMMKKFYTGWQEVLRPRLRMSKGRVLFISTPKGYNHFYDLYKDAEKLDDWSEFTFTSYDNPYLDPTEINSAKLDMTPDRFAQEYMAQFTKMEGLVYDMFQRGKHTYDVAHTLPPFSTVVTGIDWGWNNYSTIISIGVDYDGKYWVFDEWFRKHKTTGDVIDYAKTVNSDAWYPDPAEPDRLEEMRQAGFNVKEVNKDVVNGIDTVRYLLLNGKLRIRNDLKDLIAEFEGYVYKEGSQKEQVEKENDHGLDALRYALHSHKGAIPKKELDYRRSTRQKTQSEILSDYSVR